MLAIMTRKPPQWAEKLIQKVDTIDLEVRSLGVGMEEIRDDVKLLAEGQADIRQTLDEHSATLKEHTEMIGNLVVDMTVVKSTLKDHTKKIDSLITGMTAVKATLGDHTQKIDSLTTGMAAVKDKLEEKADHKEFEILESRVTRLEL